MLLFPVAIPIRNTYRSSLKLPIRDVDELLQVPSAQASQFQGAALYSPANSGLFLFLHVSRQCQLQMQWNQIIP